MKIIELLKKLGIYRAGTYSGKFTSGKDLPSELLMDNVYNSKTDLVHKGEFKKFIKIIFLFVGGVFVFFFVVGFISELFSKNDTNQQVAFTESDQQNSLVVQDSPKDKTDLLLEKIVQDNQIRDSSVNEENIIWTAQNTNLQLQKSKTLLAEDINFTKVQNYLLQNGWKIESIGFTFVNKDGRNGIGYLAPMIGDYEFKAAMCILYPDENVISCGWGPGAEF